MKRQKYRFDKRDEAKKTGRIPEAQGIMRI